MSSKILDENAEVFVNGKKIEGVTGTIEIKPAIEDEIKPDTIVHDLEFKGVKTDEL